MQNQMDRRDFRETTVPVVAAISGETGADFHEDAEFLELWRKLLETWRADRVANEAWKTANEASQVEKNQVEKPWRVSGVINRSMVDKGPWRVSEYRGSLVSGERRAQPYPEVTDYSYTWPECAKPMKEALALASAREKRDVRNYEAKLRRIEKEHRIHELSDIADKLYNAYCDLLGVISKKPAKTPLGVLVKLSIWRQAEGGDDEDLVEGIDTIGAISAYRSLVDLVGRDFVAEASEIGGAA